MGILGLHFLNRMTISRKRKEPSASVDGFMFGGFLGFIDRKKAGIVSKFMLPSLERNGLSGRRKL